MPQLLERKLKAEAQRKFPNDKERQDAYVHDTLRRRFNWTPEEEKQHREGVL
jgi:hypothetical protein